MCTCFWLEILKGREYAEESRQRGDDNIKMDLTKLGSLM